MLPTPAAVAMSPSHRRIPRHFGDGGALRLVRGWWKGSGWMISYEHGIHMGRRYTGRSTLAMVFLVYASQCFGWIMEDAIAVPLKLTQ